VGIRAYVAIPNFDFRDTGLFGPGHFRYDSENDHYLCPAGQRLRLHNEDRHNRRKRYRAKPSVCKACELKSRCTTSERGRVLYRPFYEDFYDRVRGYPVGLSRTRKPYERGRCGSSRCLPRLRIGTGCEGLGCGGSRR
jgi:DDE family transposase